MTESTSNVHWDADFLAASLTEAIKKGDIDSSRKFAGLLSELHVKLQISLSTNQNPGKEFEVCVQLEDRKTSSQSLHLTVRAKDTILDLKRKILLEQKLPIASQRWIIGKKICDDDMTLDKCGVTGPDHTIYLYIVTARSPVLERRSFERAARQARSPVLKRGSSERAAQPALSTGLDNYSCNNSRNRPQDVDLSPSPRLSDSLNPSQLFEPGSDLTLTPKVAGQSSSPPPVPPRQVTGQSSSPPPVPPRRAHQDSYDTDETRVAQPNLRLIMPAFFNEDKQVNQQGWKCSQCTFFNLPTRPGCEACTASRPDDYTVPQNYVLSEQELVMKYREEELERMTRKSEPEILTRPLAPPPNSGAGCLTPADIHLAMTRKYLEETGTEEAPASAVSGKPTSYLFLSQPLSDEDENENFV